jgi:atypical dual specificity phosphatase/dual specificity phosphatase 3
MLPVTFQESAKVVVNCFAGLSRSSSCVLAYLVLYKDLAATEALKTVKLRRDILPNNSNLAHLARIHNEASH